MDYDSPESYVSTDDSQLGDNARRTGRQIESYSEVPSSSATRTVRQGLEWKRAVLMTNQNLRGLCFWADDYEDSLTAVTFQSSSPVDQEMWKSGQMGAEPPDNQSLAEIPEHCARQKCRYFHLKAHRQMDKVTYRSRFLMSYSASSLSHVTGSRRAEMFIS